LADEYHEKVRAVYVRANGVIMDAKKKNDSYLESEKNRIHEEVMKKLQMHYEALDNDVKHVDKEFLNYLEGLKKQAQKKIFQTEKNSINDSLQLHHSKIVGNLS
jgi:F0F1-type ATP synthase membrane subunit b/b'